MRGTVSQIMLIVSDWLDMVYVVSHVPHDGDCRLVCLLRWTV